MCFTTRICAIVGLTVNVRFLSNVWHQYTYHMYLQISFRNLTLTVKLTIAHYFSDKINASFLPTSLILPCFNFYYYYHYCDCNDNGRWNKRMLLAGPSPAYIFAL